MPYRLEAVLPYVSNLPRDVASNTIYVDAASDTDAAQAAARFATFYAVPLPGDTASLGYFLGHVLSRTTNACSVRAYNMADPSPRQIVATQEFTLESAGTTGSLPYEVALCHSFHGAAPYTARRRGRNYIGPWNLGAAEGSEPPRPTADVIGMLTLLAERLRDTLQADGSPWLVRSETAGTYTPVTGGWVDNEWDTQRRRQGRPTSRTVW